MIESFNNTWQALRLKDISEMNPMFSHSDVKMVSFVPMEDLRYDSIGDKTIDQEEGRKKYTFFKEDDLLIAKVTPCFENGNISLAKNLKGGIGFGSSEIFVLRFSKQVNKRFMFYYCQNKDFKDSAQATMQGVGGLKRIQPLFFRTKAIHLPSSSEQQAIANYLDTKCCKIDASIATLKEMKDKYLSLKKSLINETVCRGLNKNVPLKSSGIDWIGDIPEHWEVKRFKDFFRDYTTGMTPDSKNENFFSFDGDNTWVSIADLNSRYVNKSSINLSDLAVKAFSPIKVFKGALMFSFKLSIGKIGFATKDLYTNEAIASLHANSHWDLNYLYYILPKILFGNANENIYGAKMLNQKTILQMLLIVPPISEQQSIAKYLDDKCSKIDSIVANIDSQIEAYTKLKKSLISEVVTGKKRVI